MHTCSENLKERDHLEDLGTEKNVSSNFSMVYICCQENVFTEPLPSSDREDTHTDTQGKPLTTEELLEVCVFSVVTRSYIKKTTLCS
jgi:hypothetical protein